MGVGHYLFGFSGRINRARMWLFFLLVVLFVIAATTAVISVIGVQTLMGVGQGTLPVAALYANPALGPTFGALGLADLVFIWISLAVTTKRLHDRDKSAWWLLVFVALPAALGIVRFGMTMSALHAGGPHLVMGNPVIAILGGATLLIQLWAFVELYCLRGTEGDNRYGPDPLAGRA